MSGRAMGPVIDPDQVVARAVIEGEPVPWPRSRINRAGKYYLPRPYAEYRALVASELRHAYDRPYPLTTRLGVLVGIYRRTMRRADIDNFAKTVLDAGNGIVWADDSQVVSLVARILPDPDNARLEVVVWILPGDRATIAGD